MSVSIDKEISQLYAKMEIAKLTAKEALGQLQETGLDKDETDQVVNVATTEFKKNMNLIKVNKQRFLSHQHNFHDQSKDAVDYAQEAVAVLHVNKLEPRFMASSVREVCIHTASRVAETQKFRWTAESGCVETIELFAGGYGVEKILAKGKRDECIMGVSLAASKAVLKVPEGLKKIKTRVYEDSDGCFLDQIIMEGKTTEKTASFYGYGDQKEVELRDGEYLIGFALKCFTEGTYKSLKTFAYIIGKQ